MKLTTHTTQTTQTTQGTEDEGGSTLRPGNSNPTLFPLPHYSRKGRLLELSVASVIPAVSYPLEGWT